MLLALSFLTTLPVPRRPAALGGLGRAAAWFPLVGLILGLLLTAGYLLFNHLFPPLLAAALLVTLWAALTGGLHLDGLADCGDGLFAALPPERRLEIMRDPRTGAFGVISLSLFLLLKVLAVASLPAADLLAAPRLDWSALAWFPAGPLIVAPVVARYLLLPAARQPTARPGGLGAELSAHLRPLAILTAGLTVLVVALLGGPRAILAVIAARLVAALIFRLARARLGGLNGDVFGFTVELAELTVLLCYPLLLP
jgi:adenosylcobinamide-GDP ribazoletransferase